MLDIDAYTVSILDEFVDNFVVRPETRVVSLDGTACCYKSSALAAFGADSVYKVQAYNASDRINSTGLGCLSYLCSGKVDFRALSQHPDNERRYTDRSLSNVLLWPAIWSFMDLWGRQFGLGTALCVAEQRDPELYRCFVARFNTVFAALRNSQEFEFFEEETNTVAVIDSDVERVEATMKQRNEGDDFRRAFEWRVYVPFQNLAYATVYGKNCFDLARLPTQLSVSSRVSCVRYILQRIMMQVEKSASRPPYILPMFDCAESKIRQWDKRNSVLQAHTKRTLMRAASRSVRSMITKDDRHDDGGDCQLRQPGSEQNNGTADADVGCSGPKRTKRDDRGANNVETAAPATTPLEIIQTNLPATLYDRDYYVSLMNSYVSGSYEIKHIHHF